jgi:CDP-diacylglycerol--glycerol-3-phosphate 3-phosphatidyltransferase
MSFVTREVKPLFERGITPLVDLLSRRGVSPDLLTFGGLALVILGSLFLYLQVGILAFILLSFGALLDAIDGALARRRGITSDFGAFIDSTVDRLSDAAPMIAIGAMYSEREQVEGVLLTFLALVGSYMVSYTRARAEALGVYGLGGAFERTERWIVLLLGILADLIALSLLIITIGAFFTAFYRIYEVRRLLNNRIL